MSDDFAYDAMREPGIPINHSVFAKLAKGEPLPDGVTVKKGRWYWKPIKLRKPSKKKP